MLAANQAHEGMHHWTHKRFSDSDMAKKFKYFHEVNEGGAMIVGAAIHLEFGSGYERSLIQALLIVYYKYHYP
ncbi:MAG: hypothetical protein DRP11_02730 [Candidatus Aenigmatarchaeota archaeon]|nr:MAG: hypothetical protein DRP11_02730 [Candidatus Aenigmarchaeota archaeon]